MSDTSNKRLKTNNRSKKFNTDLIHAEFSHLHAEEYILKIKKDCKYWISVNKSSIKHFKAENKLTINELRNRFDADFFDVYKENNILLINHLKHEVELYENILAKFL